MSPKGMIKGTSKKFRGNPARYNGTFREPPAEQVVYNGPIIPRAFARADRLHTVVCSYVIPVTTAAGSSVLQTNITNNPNQSAGWSVISTQFSEYRVMGMKGKYVPNFQNYVNTGNLGVNNAPIVYYVARNAGLFATTLSAAFDYDGATVANSQLPKTWIAKMSTSDEGAFFNCSSPTQTFGLGMYGNTFSAGTAYGYVFVDLLVQFRARQSNA